MINTASICVVVTAGCILLFIWLLLEKGEYKKGKTEPTLQLYRRNVSEMMSSGHPTAYKTLARYVMYACTDRSIIIV